MQENDKQVNAVGTKTSDFFKGKLDILMKIIDTIIPENNKILCEEYPKIY